MKALKIIGIIIIVYFAIFCLAFIIPTFLENLTRPGSMTFQEVDTKPIAWFPIGKKIKFVSEKGEVFTLEAKEIETTHDMDFLSGFETHKKLLVNDGKKTFVFTDLAVLNATYKNGKPYDEKKSLPNEVENNNCIAQFTLYNYEDWWNPLNTYNVGSNFDESITIDGKTYTDISYSEYPEIVDESKEDNGYGTKIKDINPNYKILREPGEAGEAYYINSKVWWSKTLGLMRFQRKEDGVIFTRVF
jgi:hypothetical protein